ncbi:MAG: FlaA1/EpsC-like NDP-sugar epimerase [Verrucomicrobiales bacterium]|jgi:FlaA1/EpsC-like NDP-sugar epimerase
MFDSLATARQLKESLVLRRTLAFAWHSIGIGLCYLLAYLFRLDFKLSDEFRDEFFQTLLAAYVVFLTFIVVFKLYQGLWSYFSLSDCVRYVWVYALAAATHYGVVLVLKRASEDDFNYSRAVPFIYFLLLVAWEIGGRAGLRLLRDFQTRLRGGAPTDAKRTILVGDPEHCDQLIRSLINPQLGIGEVLGLICNDKRRDGATIHGVRMFGKLKSIGDLAKQGNAQMILFLPPFATPNSIKDIMNMVAEAGCSADYRVIPGLRDIAEGNVEVDSLKRVEIEDLLNRKPNQFDRSIIENFLKGKSILVTGAGGSIGSEICRQVLSYGPSKLVLFDAAEYNLFEINRQLLAENSANEAIIHACLGDVKRKHDLERAIQRSGGKIDIVYHAAAYKHVHLVEENVTAAFLNNVIGTVTVAEVAQQAGVDQFVLVSTDKAVRPTSMMGATKRIAERFLLERETNGTSFKAVRFGNVLGSSGSVIPIFKRQIAEGGPVTVTSKEVTRFFMTIPEAVELVLMAGAVGGDRNIMVLEMGDPVLIDQLARQLIELSGLVPGKDIEIVYTGLRKGEKEYEELLTEDENVVQTAYEKIWVMAKEKAELTPISLEKIEQLVAANDGNALRRLAKDWIPENRLESD